MQEEPQASGEQVDYAFRVTDRVQSNMLKLSVGGVELEMLVDSRATNNIRELKQRRRQRQRQRKRHLKIYLYFTCATLRLLQLVQLLQNGELSRTQIGRSSAQVKKENEKFTVVRSRSPQNLKCGHFTLLFCRGRQRNVPKCKTHVQSYCFCSLNLLFCGVVVAVAVVVA